MSPRRLLVVAVACAVAAAQDAPRAGSVRGTVLDKDLGAPLAQASVTIVETGQKVATSEQGTFTFGQVAPGKYTLVVAREGYVRQVKADVVVAAGQLADVAFSLAGDFTDMEEFVVQDVLSFDTGTEVGLLQLRLESPSMVDSVSTELISRAGASDAAAALRLVSGATVQGGKTAVVRGLPDRYVVSQMNGVRLPTAAEDKRAVELDQFPSEILGSIQVAKTFTPDQQGDASGGAVDVRLKGVPDEPFFFRVRMQASHDTNVTGRGSFLTYDGGGVHQWGKDDGGRAPQLDRLGENWEGAVGVRTGEAPADYKWSVATGGRIEIADGVRLGAFANVFYERDSALSRGVDESWWIERPGAPMTPKTSQGAPLEGTFRTSLFDVTQGKQSVQWGTLGVLGLESKNHAVQVVHLQTRTAEDTATLAEDTRGKQWFFPGHDPDDPTTPGHDSLDAAPYLRLETIEYTERTTGTLQFFGRHALSGEGLGNRRSPELGWRHARSSADSVQPDKRQFGELWTPGRRVGSFEVPALHQPYKPAANFTLGNLQRTFKKVTEDSEQYAIDAKIPFEVRGLGEGHVKGGWFRDVVDRTYDQDSFSNFGDNTTSAGPWEQPYSSVFRFQDHPITESKLDVDYDGTQKIDAFYAMADVPVVPHVHLVGGWRWEQTRLSIVNDAEEEATWFPPGSLSPTQLNPGDADVGFTQHDALPSIGLVFTPWDFVTLRTSYAETVARQTFKELSPILQQEYLGGPIFIGNPDLRMSAVKNWDVRLDLTPAEGSLLSASWFKKDIEDPIEYVQKLAAAGFDFTTPVNYPKGELEGFELEARQALGAWWSPLDGLSIGANATFLRSKVVLPDDEAAGFALPNIGVSMRTRDMTNAPAHLYNAFVTYDLAATGTQLGLFWTAQGDSLVAGAGQSNGNFVPNVYTVGYDTLNASLSQRLGRWIAVSLGAKNLTTPTVREVYRSELIEHDVTKTSFDSGIEYTLTIGGEYSF